MCACVHFSATSPWELYDTEWTAGGALTAEADMETHFFLPAKGWRHLKILVVFKASALCRNVLMSVCVFVCVFVCPSHFLTTFIGLFAPTSRSLTSKLFRYSESLGKEVVSDLKFFAQKRSKIAAGKKVF